jgi:hypothetical protein
MSASFGCTNTIECLNVDATFLKMLDEVGNIADELGGIFALLRARNDRQRYDMAG